MPSGSTNNHKQKLEQSIVNMKNDIALEYKSEYERFQKEGEQMKPGKLKEIVEIIFF